MTASRTRGERSTTSMPKAAAASTKAPRISDAEKKSSRNKPDSIPAQSASALIDQRIAELNDWRGKTLSAMRLLIHKADADVVEEWKWSIPIWSHDGILCTGESYKEKVKLTFAKGASLADPARLFNSGLAGNTRRAIDIHDGDEIGADAFKALIRAAIALNISGAKAKRVK